MIIQASIVTTPAQILAAATDWRTAVTDLINWFVDQGRCFSSGEITAYLRTYRGDLRFSATGIGEYIRDQYDNGLIPMYDISGAAMYPTQVPRVTTGTSLTIDGRQVQSKTAPGMTVFVYAPDQLAGQAHDFEVFIPDWDDPQALRAVPASSVSTPVVTPQTTLNRADLVAAVRPDRRLQVPRAAFDAMVAASGQALRGGPNGDPVYITFQGTDVRISRSPVDGSSTTHYLWAQRGRMAFTHPTSPFTPGLKYEVRLDGSDLILDLSKTV